MDEVTVLNAPWLKRKREVGTLTIGKWLGGRNGSVVVITWNTVATKD